jgi:hypothetical protein
MMILLILQQSQAELNRVFRSFLYGADTGPIQDTAQGQYLQRFDETEHHRSVAANVLRGGPDTV